jgi:phospholipase C
MTDSIKHVILLLLENHSFDQMLGCFQQVYEDLDGIDPTKRSDRVNHDPDGNPYFPGETRDKQMELDPRHELEHVRVQLENNNSGFVKDFATAYPGSSRETRQQIMGYYPLDFLPALHHLAKHFTICDRWYSSLPGPTWPNRFFALSGTASGRVSMPAGITHPDLANLLFDQNQSTIFDRLNEAGRSWKVYYYDFPCSLILTHQRRPRNVAHYVLIDQFFKDVYKEETFPEFCFIEPKYFGTDQNDDHPPHNVMKTEKLIADVYNAVRAHEDLWNSTLLVVLFDEHGGFYDHVSPPLANPPDQHTEEYTFDRLGVRVPALLVSPWVSRRVEHTTFDHTSLLRYMVDKWQLAPLGERTAKANSIGVAIKESAREDTIPFIRVSYTDLVPPKPDLERKDSSAYHQALHAFADFLSREVDKEAGAALQAIAKEAGVLTTLKNKLGMTLIRWGTLLTRESDDIHSKRIAQTMSAVIKLMQRKS